MVDCRAFTFREPGFVVFYCLLVGYFVFLGLHYARKRGLEARFERRKGSLLASDPLLKAEDQRDAAAVFKMKQYGYKEDLFGQVMLAMTVCYSIGWFLLLGLLVSDYYQLHGGE